MKTYELQVYQNGAWQFDSYFDSKDLVLSEAERMNTTGRYMGVRVLEETFDEARQSSSYHTIFSRLRKLSGSDDNWRKKAQRGHHASHVEGGHGRDPARRGAPRRPVKSGSNLFLLVLGGMALMAIGIGAIIVLRSIAGLA